jgi:hypothetical protein
MLRGRSRIDDRRRGQWQVFFAIVSSLALTVLVIYLSLG